MIDVVLFAGRILLVAFLYIFLFAIMKTGIGLVRGQRRKERSWSLTVEHGPKELMGVPIPVKKPITVGRSPEADIVIGSGYVSSMHAKFSLMGNNLFVEDLNSANGTIVNRKPISNAVSLKNNDVVNTGDVAFRVRFE